MKRVAALAVILLVHLLLPEHIGAEETVEVRVTEVGWWTSSPVPVPQPEGGFQVSASPTGETQSVAALRLSIAATEVTTLQVRFAESGSSGVQFGSLQLCPTTDAWTAANPGAMDAAPNPDCSVSALLTRTAEGVWLGDIAALAPRGGEVSVMVLPNYQPPAPVGPGMVVAISGGQFTATGSNQTTTTLGGGSSGGSGSTGSSSTDYFFAPTGGGSFGVPATNIEPDFGTVPAESTTTTTLSDTDDEFALTPITRQAEPAAPWVRLIVLIPLSAGFGVGTVRLRRAIAEGLLWGR